MWNYHFFRPKLDISPIYNDALKEFGCSHLKKTKTFFENFIHFFLFLASVLISGTFIFACCKFLKLTLIYYLTGAVFKILISWDSQLSLLFWMRESVLKTDFYPPIVCSILYVLYVCHQFLQYSILE